MIRFKFRRILNRNELFHKKSFFEMACTEKTVNGHFKYL
ncbi:hypothetical protein LEP1GSC021_4999 [Leptospira noguchii str. 1993005606]|uniref:Uncharacterized protein n=2 Tax=Leptospira noguchii TaxID=28182 RepID=M6Y7X7_9LEPT|nr:hypothetical protein LEP1GSC035_3166 [Leptospira noguchii str. 2007001578]EMO90432.1 hypothetical protein LEP1GSC024_2234 [Leptospira noguchii str. 2001034031]EPE85023.1 hypothetical protein LEP1GSC021_4999 [Leptospira noguchii str. 1993005606]